MRFTVYSNDWFLEKLDNVCQFVRDGTHGSFKDVEIGIPLLSAKDIFDGKININENSRLISIDDYNTIHKNYELTKGDILLTIVGTIGRTAMVNMDEKFTLQRSVAILRVNEQISYNFLYYYIQTSAFQNRLKSVVNQSAQGGVYLNSLKKLNIKLTADMNEQNKISSFLSIIDKKIELLEQKYQNYQEFKKYLMQQIFTQKLRFADDENWVTVTIANIFDNITDYVAAGSFADIRKNVTYLKDPDYAQLIRTADLKSNFTNGDFVYVDKHAFEYLWRVNLDEPCIVLPNIGNIGEVYYINPKELPYSNNALAPNAILLKSNDNIKFKYYLLESPYFKNQLDIINEAGGRGKFNKTNLKKIKIKVPNNDLEKEKIAKCLSNVDNKLKLFNIQLIEIQDFKKGLLQQMFVVRINWRCNFKLAKSPSFNKHLLILKNKIIFIIIE